MMANMIESAAGGGEADGAVVLAIEIMEHRSGEDKDEDNGYGLFHAFAIIPSLGAGVKPDLLPIPG